MAPGCLDVLKVFLSLTAHSHISAFSWSGWFLNLSPRSPWCTEKPENVGWDAATLASRKSPGQPSDGYRNPLENPTAVGCEHTGWIWLSSERPVWNRTLGTWADSLDASISHHGFLETETWRGPALPGAHPHTKPVGTRSRWPRQVGLSMMGGQLTTCACFFHDPAAAVSRWPWLEVSA